MIDSDNLSLTSSYETVQPRNYLDFDCRPLLPKMLRDRQRAKELKNLVREFCEDRDAGRLVHPNGAGVVFDRVNGKTRLIISSVGNNQLSVRVIINGFTIYFYVNVKFNRTPLAYNWWKAYSRRITKKLGKIMISTRCNMFYTSDEIEKIMFGKTHHIEDNTYVTTHQTTNIYSDPLAKYEVRIGEHALDIQINDNVE